MARTAYQCVDDYLAAQPDAAKPALDAVRAAIRSALPGAEEVISYQIPAYKVAGRVVLFFAGWKKHYSLYPVSEGLLATLADELNAYEVEKGTIRFPLSQPVPADLIGRIAVFKAEEVSAGAKAQNRR